MAWLFNKFRLNSFIVMSFVILLAIFANNTLATDKTVEAYRATSLGKQTFDDVQGKVCVIKDTMHMRKNHMRYIIDRRTETTRHGMRWPKEKHEMNFSLEKCINCHARDAKGDPVPVKLNGKANKEHFCVNCHQHTAVTIDCFNCHSGKPTGPANALK